MLINVFALLKQVLFMPKTLCSIKLMDLVSCHIKYS